MHYPYQCLQICGNILVAASTSHLDTFNLADGVRLHSWDYASDIKETDSVGSKSGIGSPVLEPHRPASSAVKISPGSEPLAKKMKFSDGSILDVAKSVDCTPATDKGDELLHHLNPVPNIIALAATQDGRHVIAVTGEDKSINVLEHDLNGHLKSVNRRAMPKRPCAITLTADDSTIICADKFGDVYSLPLLVDSHPLESDLHTKSSSTDSMGRKPFVSAANDLTIHTARNRRALQNQLRQDQKPSEKADPKFEHKLLLGHVSMLTNIRIVERDRCSYIITADRDEHIRVSRGIPQTHIIERYCLGHEEFITELCLPTTFPNLLLSGGGDDDIYAWDWFQGNLLKKTHLRNIVEATLEPSPACGGHETAESARLDTKPTKIAVSCICHVAKRQEEAFDCIIITCEGVPALFFFHLVEDGSLMHYCTVKLDGNPLSTVVDLSTGRLVVSVDCLHESGSRMKVRSHEECPIQRLRVFQREGPSWVESRFETDRVDVGIEDHGMSELSHKLTSLLYTLENLRKHNGED